VREKSCSLISSIIGACSAPGSRRAEGGHQKYDAAKKGNSRGVSVRTVSINIEKDKPKQDPGIYQRKQVRRSY